MKFFLTVWIFTSGAFAEQTSVSGVNLSGNAGDPGTERIRVAQQAGTVDSVDSLEFDVKSETPEIRLIPQWKNLRPEVKRMDLLPKIQWIKPPSERELIEIYSDMSVMGKHISNLIVVSDGALCELSQDPLQCCNTFAQNPDQCLFEKINKGLLDPSSLLKEGVCNMAQNREGCASQVESSILLQLVVTQRRE